MKSRVSQAQEGKQVELMEQILLRPDGRTIDVEATAIPTIYDGKPATLSVIKDITERKKAEEALRESEQRFRSAFENAPIGVALVGLDRRYLRVNRVLCEMLGYSKEELLAKTSSEIAHPDDLGISEKRTRWILEEEAQSSYVEKRYIHPEGPVVWAMSSISLIRDSQGNPSHFVSLFQDIAERKTLEDQLRHQALYDSLTELPNCALLLDRLVEALDRGHREGSLVTLLLVDLDNFKIVNDSLGHDTGNALLLEVAKRLQVSVMPGDTVARLSGDKFVILLETNNLDEAQWI